MNKRLRLKVTGIDCGACAQKIEDQIKDLNGVRDVKVNFLLENIRLIVSENIEEVDLLDDIDSIIRKVERHGQLVR